MIVSGSFVDTPHSSIRDRWRFVGSSAVYLIILHMKELRALFFRIYYTPVQIQTSINMNSQRNMVFSAIVASCVIATTLAAGAEYLPPNKGYDYKKPDIPFPQNQPTPPPGVFRPSPVATKRPPNGYIPPSPTNKPYNPPPTGPVNDNTHDEHHHHHEPGMPFDFSYAVNEDGNDYSHNAISDGDVTRGMYRVALPDGRTQVVKYTADWKNGFNAEVTYEGEAKYPDQPSAGYADSPVARPGQQYVPPNQGGGYQY